MDETIPVWLRVGYTVATSRRGRVNENHVTSTTVPAPLAIVDVADTSVVAIARRKEDPPSEVVYRQFDGRLYRPMFDPGLKNTLTPAALEAYVESKNPMESNFQDYPAFRSVFGGVRQTAIGRPDARPTHGRRFVSDDRDAKVSEALAAASKMIVVDGVIHVPALPPVWAIGQKNHEPQTVYQYSLFFPDLETDFHGPFWLTPANEDPEPLIRAAIASYAHPFLSMRNPQRLDGEIEFTGAPLDYSGLVAENARRLLFRLDFHSDRLTMGDLGPRATGRDWMRVFIRMADHLSAAQSGGTQASNELAHALAVAKEFTEATRYDPEVYRLSGLDLAGSLLRAPVAIEAARAHEPDDDLISAAMR